MNLRHPRVISKFILSRITLVQNYCKRCGKRSEPFQVPDSLWHEVIGNGKRDERCLRCFHLEASDHGHHLEWSLRTDTDDREGER